MALRWYRIDVAAIEGFKPPFFAGSMLRGALGVGLKRVVCINPTYRCGGCFAVDQCLYYDFYERQNIYHAYRIVSSLGMDRLQFRLYLFESATMQLPYMLSAIKMALENIGLGKQKERVMIECIDVNGQNVYRGGQFGSLAQMTPKHLAIESFYQDVHLQFRLPLRIKNQNHLSKEVALPLLINSIHQRYRQIKGLEREKLGYKVQGRISKTHFRHLDLYRYSNRQRTRMKLGGLMGSLTIEGLDKQSYLYLKMGEVIGAGKQTVFGLGSYTLRPIERKEDGE